MPDPIDQALDAAARGLANLTGPRRKNRADRRAHHVGTGAGQGKHPTGATKPLPEERRAARRAKAAAAKTARRKGRR